ncbi:MAG: trypsin-like peptidase domain-containing protein [Phycisphaerales bacterium]|nr:MAG: trypsin-like peptidase domain-containing protein [Phycisphaerales bacterium]
MSTRLGRSLVDIRRFVLVLLVFLVGLGASRTASAEEISKPGIMPSGRKVPARLSKSRCAACRGAATAEPDLLRRHFAEIEATLSDKLTLEMLRSLPKAPGSVMKILHGGKRVRAQLEAVAVGDLLEKGVSLTVRRDFMLVTKSGKAAVAESMSKGFVECSGPMVEGGNETDFPIPEGDWAYSDIVLDGATENAQVTCLDVHYEIVHPRASDLVIDLTDEGISIEHRLWNRQDAERDNLSRTVTGITSFAGLQVNQAWTLWAQDEEYGQTGHIDDWWIKVYYVACPAGDACSGPSAGGSNSADHWIPFYDRTHSDITISGVTEPAYVTCVDIHYEIRHPYVSDLVIDLTNADTSREYRLWGFEGGEAVNIEETVIGIEAFANEPVNQTWSLWAEDEGWGDDGYIDSWWIKIYYRTQPAVVSHDSCENAIAVENGVPYRGTTAGATGDDETTCAQADHRDVWYVYTAPHTSLATVTLACTTFDTTLAIYDGCGGRELVCSDDTCGTTDSQLTLLMTGGTNYFVRIAGYRGQMGRYTLMVNQNPAALPDEPNQPHPADGAPDVAADTVLAWNGWTEPVRPAVLSQAAPTQVKQGKVIYGSDDRIEEYAVNDPGLRAAGDATVIFVDWDQLTENGDGTYALATTTLTEYYEWANPLGTGNQLCEDEPFRDQPTTGGCSGILVAPDLVATAGHCTVCDRPSDTAVVFGFVMLDDLTPVLNISAADVYRCVESVGHQDGDSDWSLVRLERPVTNHIPVPMRRTGKVADNQSLLVIGHPHGLPRKYDAGGRVRDNMSLAYFQADLDTYKGSSGSPVINLDSMALEGLLVDGNEDFAEDVAAGCDRSNVCPESGCPDWESITRATLFSPAVPSFDVYLGTDPEQLQIVGTDVVTPWLDAGDLERATTYYWRVTARNASGETLGPVWSFTTQ